MDGSRGWVIEETERIANEGNVNGGWIMMVTETAEYNGNGGEVLFGLWTL